ncbi:hypothetical protein [Rhizobium sp.]|uniref:hypothetical protein n=1 Tax=Rhizobium sp. TaxID=391 RepID=UPI0028A5B060
MELTLAEFPVDRVDRGVQSLKGAHLHRGTLLVARIKCHASQLVPSRIWKTTGTFSSLAASSDMENLKPCQKVLIVEDQYLIAMMIEDAVIAAGFDVCGMAACRQDVLDLFDETDIALVDVNVRAGKTGPGIGAELAAAGKTVIFMTGNPEEVSSGVSGALGVISKPVFDPELAFVSYAPAHYGDVRHSIRPPRNLHLFA